MRAVANCNQERCQLLCKHSFDWGWIDKKHDDINMRLLVFCLKQLAGFGAPVCDRETETVHNSSNTISDKCKYDNKLLVF